MRVLHDHEDRTGKRVMYAFNVTDEIDTMWRNLDLLTAHGANCAMVCMSAVGISGLRALRDRAPHIIHGHRAGWGLYSRSPDIGISFGVWQKLWRLAGADHLHVNGLGNDEFIFCAGGGIQGHPDGPAVGVIALRQAARAVRVAREGVDVEEFARTHPELARARHFQTPGTGSLLNWQPSELASRHRPPGPTAHRRGLLPLTAPVDVTQQPGLRRGHPLWRPVEWRPVGAGCGGLVSSRPAVR